MKIYNVVYELYIYFDCTGGKIIRKLGIIVALLIAMVLFASGCAEPAQEVENETEGMVEEVTEEAGAIVEEAEDLVGENKTETMPDKNIIQTAEDAGTFKTLVTAIKAAGLEETLSGEGPFTVFAPTDEAFAALPEGTLDSLLEDKEALTNILLYHVASGKYMAADVVNMTSIPTLEGSELPVDTTEGVKVGDANVTATDIEATNGVIHVIDKVLIPPE